MRNKIRIHILVWLTIMPVFCHTEEPSCANTTFRLITTLYNEKKSPRANEYIACLEKNLAHPNIASIHVLYDTSKDGPTNTIRRCLEEKEVGMTFIKGRPSYARCFQLANELYPDQNVIIANADIYFDETLADVDSTLLEEHVLALTRWDIRADGSAKFHGKTGGSHDVWIFRTPLTIPPGARKIILGMQHCDIRIAYELSATGYRVFNPCFSVKCFHLHLSEIRSYRPAARPPKGVMPLVWSTLEKRDALTNTDLVILAHGNLEKATRIVQGIAHYMGHFELQNLKNIHVISDSEIMPDSDEVLMLKAMVPYLTISTAQPSQRQECLQTLAKESNNTFMIIVHDELARRYSPVELCVAIQCREQTANTHNRCNGRPDPRQFGEIMRRLNRDRHITLQKKSDLIRGRGPTNNCFPNHVRTYHPRKPRRR